jgi:hypothetical protein
VTSSDRPDRRGELVEDGGQALFATPDRVEQSFPPPRDAPVVLALPEIVGERRQPDGDHGEVVVPILRWHVDVVFPAASSVTIRATTSIRREANPGLARAAFRRRYTGRSMGST